MAASLILIACALGQTIADDGLNQSIIEQAYQRNAPAVVVLKYSMEILNPGTGEVTRRSGDALGLLVTPDGLVMTHGHMVIENRNPFNVKVEVGEGDRMREYDATLLRKPEDVNVVFLKIDADGVQFPHVRFARNPNFRIGDPFFSIGILSESMDHARSIQTRRIGAILREPRTTYAVDQPVTFGFVGGPVFDAQGNAVGVLGFDLGSNEGGEIYTRSGHPLIFQASLFQPYIDNPPGDDTGSDDDAWLGVFTQPLTDDLASYWNLPKNGGVVVSTVIPGSPAETMGLQSGDVVVQFNGVPVTAKQDNEVITFTKIVRESPIGQPLPVHIYRDGGLEELSLTLTQRPRSARDAEEFEDTVFGLTVREITTDARIAMNIPSTIEGVLVRRVRSGSTANQAGIRTGFIILRLGDHPITSLADLRDAIANLEETRPLEIPVLCRVGANTAFFRMQPRWPANE